MRFFEDILHKFICEFIAVISENQTLRYVVIYDINTEV